MHIPVLLCGLICGWQYGLVCGLLGPLLSSLLTQMPPMAILPSMMAELAVYGAVTGLMMYAFKYKTTYLSLYTSLAVALISGRVVSGILKALIFSAGNYSFSVWVTASFVTCLPGLAIQLAIIPTLVKVLAKAKLLPRRQAQNRLDFDFLRGIIIPYYKGCDEEHGSFRDDQRGKCLLRVSFVRRVYSAFEPQGDEFCRVPALWAES